MDNKEKNTFNYTYSAKQQDEIKAIRNKYIKPKEQEDKMAQLRSLDASVTDKATVVSLVFGIIGTLIMGFGMSIVMTDLSEFFCIHENYAVLIGSCIGVIGIILICAAYPIYNHIVKKERERIAPEIIRLTDELMK